MINFKLKDVNKICPVGKEPDLYLSWFWLTDGDLWLTFGAETIYEYSDKAIKHFGEKTTAYNDYFLVRFIEDFTGIFNEIRESIPKMYYDLTKDLTKFQVDAQKWLAIYDTDENEHSEFYFEEYDKLVSWTYRRMFDSAHLIGGPHLSFFRCNNKLRVVWETEHILENGISLWTAKDGSFEMDYADFVDRVRGFGESFFREMDKQVQLSVEKEWGNITVDKQKLVEEHEERKQDFFAMLSLLEQEPENKSNWTEIEQLFNRMTKEISNP